MCRVGNINPIPFRQSNECKRAQLTSATQIDSFSLGQLRQHCVGRLHHHSFTVLPVALGPPDPCSTAVHTEPFSTSVYKVLTCIFATTTEICSHGCSTPTRVVSFVTTMAPVYSTLPTRSRRCRRSDNNRTLFLQCRSSISPSLQRHPFSGLVNSAGKLLHTS